MLVKTRREPGDALRNLFVELRRHYIFRVAGVYAVVGWLLAQVAATLESAVALTTDPVPMVTGSSIRIFSTTISDQEPTYDVTANGERVLAARPSAAAPNPSGDASLVVVTNWFEELNRLAPAPQ